MKAIFKIFTVFTRQQQWYCIFLIGCMLIGAIFEAIGIGAIFPLISIMNEPSFLANNKEIARFARMAGINNDKTFIIVSAFILIIFYLIKSLYMAWQSKLQIQFSRDNQIYYAGALLAGYLKKPYLYHLNQNSATLLRNVNSGASTAFSGILIPTFALITEVITAVMIWALLIMVDLFTAIVVAGILGGIMYFILRIFRKKIAKQGENQNKHIAMYLKWLNQGLGSIKETKILRKEGYFLQQFNKFYKMFGEENCEFIFLSYLPKILIEAVVVCGLLALIITKLLVGLSPVDIVPLLGVLALAAFRLMPCANRIVNLLNSIKFQMPLFCELYPEFIEIKRRRVLGEEIFSDLENDRMIFNKTIKIEGMSFCYPGGVQNIFDNISFEIPKGKFIGIIGSSGAGKTTFVDILLGLLQPTSGDVFVDKQSIYRNIRAWQADLAYVPQNIYLIDGSIRKNIALGIQKTDIDPCRIDQVVKMAELSSFIENLPNGLDTEVGERGVKLSGGQRQRIGIARALYCNPTVLILDEATSALDTETEENITDTILKLKGQITIIAIAHRVSTLEQCDFKMKFENGKVERIN